MDRKTAKKLFSELEYLLDTHRIGGLIRFRKYFNAFKDGRTIEQARSVILNLVISYADTLRNNPLREFLSMDLNLIGIFQEIEYLVSDQKFKDLIARAKNAYKLEVR